MLTHEIAQRIDSGIWRIKRSAHPPFAKAEAIARFISSAEIQGLIDNEIDRRLYGLDRGHCLRSAIMEEEPPTLVCMAPGLGADYESEAPESEAETIEPIRSHYEPKCLSDIFSYLHKQTVAFLTTARKVALAFHGAPDFDWSSGVLPLRKAFELETIERLLRPLSRACKGKDLAADMADHDLGRVARFCTDSRFKPPELGTIGHFLVTAIHSRRRSKTSNLLKAFHNLVQSWPNSLWLVQETGLTTALKRLVNDFRNPAAHLAKLDEDRFTECQRFVSEAPEMLLVKLFSSTGGQTGN